MTSGNRITSVVGFLLLACASPAWADVCRVTADGSAANDGSSWAMQAMDLQTALADLRCDEIWVAAGLYKPVVPADMSDVTLAERQVSFRVRPGTAVYGGFAGTEAHRADRDPDTRLTVLSGDIDGNDVTNAEGVVERVNDLRGRNSFHVVFMDGTAGSPIVASTVLDGLVITAGYADYHSMGEHPDQNGGALYCDGAGVGNECSPLLANLTVTGNRQSRGAIYSGGANGGVSSPILANITFTANSGNGGAMYNDGSEGGTSSPVLSHVTFDGNCCGNGGAMYNNAGDGGNSSPFLIDTVFIGNRADYRGGAVYNDASRGGVSSPKLQNVSFTNNSVLSFAGFAPTGYGGAIYNTASLGGESSPTLSNVTFHKNWAGARGGAIYSIVESTGVSNPTLANVTFSTNAAGAIGIPRLWGRGGAMFNAAGGGGESSPSLTNVTFNDNTADWGGAIFNISEDAGVSRPILTNVILWGDVARLEADAPPTAGNEVFNYGDAEPVIRHSIVEGSGGSGNWDPALGVDAGGNLDVDPLLGPLQDNGGFGHTMLPGMDSPAIDAGDAASCPDADQREIPRPQGGSCDIGAVEVVQSNGPGAGGAIAIPTLDWRALLLLTGLLVLAAALGIRRQHPNW